MKTFILGTLVLFAAFASSLQGQTVNLTPTVTSTTPDGLLKPVPQPEMMSLIPAFPASDMTRTVAFYTKLGFFVVLPGANYTAVGRDQVQLGLALDKTASKGRKASCYINMTDVDTFYSDIKSKGIRPMTEIRTQPSKMREFSVADPDGNVVTFGEYMGQK